jgi:hypothetical protein
MEEIKKLNTILVRTYDRRDILRETGRKGRMLLQLFLFSRTEGREFDSSGSGKDSVFSVTYLLVVQCVRKVAVHL